MAIITLRHGNSEAEIAPEAGGSLAAWRCHGDDIMRRATRDAIDRRDPLGFAMFPLVPWSNRIAHGRFRFGGHDVQLPLNFGDHPHAIHGHGWQRPWDIIESSTAELLLAYDHVPDSWPWAYRAELRFVLGGDSLAIDLSVENHADEPMPAGLGLHPYYDRTPALQLHARLDGWWDTDAYIMPTAYRPVPPKTDWSDWLHAPTTTDNVFSGWDGAADLVWPERNLAVTIAANEPAQWMVVYSPTNEAIACIEPVTHPTDAINQPGLPGLRILQPGERFDLQTRFAVRRLD